MPESSPANARPIELVTESGFSILRLWEINREPLPLTGRYNFLVRNPPNTEREITVEIADELVVEIELDGAQRSTRYPGGVALRFAGVLRYREDKPASEADTIESVRKLRRS